MTPGVFDGLPSHVNDEYALTQYLGYQEAERRLKAHWESWVTEADIIQLKNAGINHVRIPLGRLSSRNFTNRFILCIRIYPIYNIF